MWITTRSLLPAQADLMARLTGRPLHTLTKFQHLILQQAISNTWISDSIYTYCTWVYFFHQNYAQVRYIINVLVV